jgi:tRNA pseudouridine55 synthase
MRRSWGTQKQLPEQRQASTIRRVTGGLVFSAGGGKRQEHIVPQWLQEKPGANHPVRKTRLSGIVVVDKPKDISSARVVADVKHLLDARKVGHAGTLDPFAEGVLVCCINDATRLARFLLAGNKAYEATLKLGIETDTQDLTGTVTASHPVGDWPDDKIKSTVKKFEGRIEQRPPVFSALKHRGTPLYKLARRGKPVQKPARQVHIAKIDILEIKLPLVRFEVSCSAGTYIRTLCADLGKQLGCGGHLQALRRTASSGFKIQQAIPLRHLAERIQAGENSRLVIPMADALTNMPTCIADQELIKRIRHGKSLNRSDIKIEHPSAKSDDHVDRIKIVDGDNILIAVLNYDKSKDRISYVCVFQN